MLKWDNLSAKDMLEHLSLARTRANSRFYIILIILIIIFLIIIIISAIVVVIKMANMVQKQLTKYGDKFVFIFLIMF